MEESYSHQHPTHSSLQNTHQHSYMCTCLLHPEWVHKHSHNVSAGENYTYKDVLQLKMPATYHASTAILTGCRGTFINVPLTQ